VENELLGNFSPLDIVDACLQAIENRLGEVFASIISQFVDEFFDNFLVRESLHPCDIFLIIFDMMVSVGYETEFDGFHRLSLQDILNETSNGFFGCQDVGTH